MAEAQISRIFLKQRGDSQPETMNLKKQLTTDASKWNPPSNVVAEMEQHTLPIIFSDQAYWPNGITAIN
ncbi:TPA: hypothetical protein ACOFC4_000815 [Stenotrophomonas maltophilia]|uniref:hypothetical protein n=1 Tax=Stenotrophomonas maltophilia TaxID=40324 RepID=UPI001FA7A9E7|nr:hypothetical protein [Stenotrophomonas maltophilia]HDX0836453.1 hypothetical protein [Stenotrophomonas maltophilia]